MGGEGIIGARDEGIEVRIGVAISGEDVVGMEEISSGVKIEGGDVRVM